MRNSLDISRALLGCALIAILGLVACASTPEKDILEPEDVMPEEFAGAPSWVIEGCHALDGDERGKLICGVGSMGGSRNISLMRTTALARGRTEIARTLEVQVKAMLKDYQATTTGGEEFGTAASDEQHVIDVSKQITDFSLSGTEMKDSWVSRSGTFYALVVLDVERFKDSVNEMKELSASVREAVQKRAEANWGELDEEVESERNR
jgi:hypothetical protein